MVSKKILKFGLLSLFFGFASAGLMHAMNDSRSEHAWQEAYLLLNAKKEPRIVFQKDPQRWFSTSSLRKSGLNNFLITAKKQRSMVEVSLAQSDESLNTHDNLEIFPYLEEVDSLSDEVRHAWIFQLSNKTEDANGSVRILLLNSKKTVMQAFIKTTAVIGSQKIYDSLFTVSDDVKVKENIFADIKRCFKAAKSRMSSISVTYIDGYLQKKLTIYPLWQADKCSYFVINSLVGSNFPKVIGSEKPRLKVLEEMSQKSPQTSIEEERESGAAVPYSFSDFESEEVPGAFEGEGSYRPSEEPDSHSHN